MSFKVTSEQFSLLNGQIESSTIVQSSFKISSGILDIELSAGPSSIIGWIRFGWIAWKKGCSVDAPAWPAYVI